MPELPDIVAYIEAIEQRILNQTLEIVQIGSPFLLRTAAPPITLLEGKKVTQLRRLGKRICIGFENDLWLVLHLMIAGRLQWHQRGAKLAGRQNLAAFDFPNGSLVLTETACEALNDVFGMRAGRIAFDDAGAFATELEDRFRQLARSYGIHPPELRRSA